MSEDGKTYLDKPAKWSKCSKYLHGGKRITKEVPCEQIDAKCPKEDCGDTLYFEGVFIEGLELYVYAVCHGCESRFRMYFSWD